MYATYYKGLTTAASPKSGVRSVGIVRLRTKATEFSLTTAVNTRSSRSVDILEQS
jgi:hypothetical protein